MALGAWWLHCGSDRFYWHKSRNDGVLLPQLDRGDLRHGVNLSVGTRNPHLRRHVMGIHKGGYREEQAASYNLRPAYTRFFQVHAS